mgnify:CR=1 FL=1
MSDTKNIIADTNVWYDIAGGNTDILNAIKKQGALCATPINMLEISSKVNAGNFQDRKNAAKAIADHTDRYLMSNEIYLARYWGFNVNDSVQWREVALTLSRANSLSDLTNGYYDPIDNVRRKHNLDVLFKWRGDQYKDFKDGVVRGIESIHPGYNQRTAGGNLKRLTNPSTISLFDDNYDFESSVLATYERAKMAFKDKEVDYPSKPTKKMIEIASPKLKNYLNVYNKYLKFLSTTPAFPDENDLGDHDAFLYLQNRNWILATSDKRWVAIAKEVCPNNLLGLLSYK